MRRILILTFVTAAGCLIASPALTLDDRPNIVVFYTDDHGHADLSCQGVLDDIKTPNVDALAKSGVLARHGYSTAPQCVPSRAGLMVGKFQSKFGVEANGKTLEGFDRELTIAERLQKHGYVTAQFGKWHLGPGPQITDHGFKHVFNQNAQRPFSANITLQGKDRKMGNLPPAAYHVDGCSQAAALAGIETLPDDLDGVNLIPYLSGNNSEAPHEALMWRWVAQSAIREGNWKLLRGGDREYLYNLDADIEEKHNVAAKHPEIASRLRARLTTWSETLDPPGLATSGMAQAWSDYFDFYLEGKAPTRTRALPNVEADQGKKPIRRKR